MTDTTTALARIRALAEAGRELAQDHESPHDYEDEGDDPYRELRVSFEAILHNVKRLEDAMIAEKIVEATMTTDTTDDAQWWRVDHDRAGWGVCRTSESAYLLGEWLRTDTWQHTATVKCPSNATEHDIYQAAVDVWREAGFVHAPKEPPRPKRVEQTVWALVPSGKPLEFVLGHHQSHMSAANWCPKGWRIVKVEAVVSECEGE